MRKGPGLDACHHGVTDARLDPVARPYLGTGFYKTLAAILAVGWLCSYIYLGAYIIESVLGKRTVAGKAAERAFNVVGKASLLALFVAWAVVSLLDGTFR